MALNIGSFTSGYNAYNIPSVKDNPQVAPQPELQPQSKQAQQEKEQEKKGLDLTVEVPARENASIENVAISFGQYDSSSLDIYGDMGLASRDMKNAISGMQKDRILHEYQYFVGGKDLTGKPSNIIAGTEDGIVIKL
ncbi:MULTISPECIES: hypothetical protein [unclassified Butyrivibrio]|jgi:hypothetical protein|uniref:hypothetical protein n=1 Tax=unclassified Butyrivibrio TaxID=2639466 RepID=UPI0003B77771|nr:MULTISPECIES: hypothetical protein [unclassified Butyrivibrio]